MDGDKGGGVYKLIYATALRGHRTPVGGYHISAPTGRMDVPDGLNDGYGLQSTSAAVCLTPFGAFAAKFTVEYVVVARRLMPLSPPFSSITLKRTNGFCFKCVCMIAVSHSYTRY